MMRTIIAGSRGMTDVKVIGKAVSAAGWTPSVVISGEARGADRAGVAWAEACGIPVEKYPADWGLHGRAAGMVRNRDMAKVADALIAVWDGESRGTRNMIKIAQDRGLKVFIHLVHLNGNSQE